MRCYIGYSIAISGSETVFISEFVFEVEFLHSDHLWNKYITFWLRISLDDVLD